MKIISDNQMKSIKGIIIPEVNYLFDNRGSFYELYKKSMYKNFGIKKNFVQQNISISKKNVLRGMHFQINKPQGQLLTVIEGIIYDVCVDLRHNSKNFGKWFACYLNSKEVNQIYMSPGFAHGFYVISNFAILHYNVTEEFDRNDENGFIWNDDTIKIKWPCKKPIISSKDRLFKTFKENQKKLPKI